jgi:hypothetical protein
MYINQLIVYLVWPVFIIVSWFIIRAVVMLYEKKFPESGTDGDKCEDLSS